MPMIPEAVGRDAGLRADRRDRTRWSSAASPPRRCATASTTPAPSWSSPPTAAARRGKPLPLKADRRRGARPQCPTVENVRRAAADRQRGRRWTGGPRPLVARRDGRGVDADARAEPFDAEHPLFILYTSRHDRQAEGHPAHHRRLPRSGDDDHASGSSTCSDDDVYWCTADIGWVTGHTYVVYGPLANGATQVHVRGRPGHPGPGPLVGDHREVQGHASSTPRRRRSARS